MPEQFKFKLYQEGDYKRLSGSPATRPEDEVGRSAFDKDYGRLLHSPSFRRLQGKTQLFPGSEDDYFRNRLTHSLEVAQIAAGIANRLNEQLREEFNCEPINVRLVEFASLAHDLGHPPFGHNGEIALHNLMSEQGGFEGNAQTLHILASLETKLIVAGGEENCKYGLDLTPRALAAVLKYDAQIIDRARGTALQKGYYGDERELVRTIKDRIAPGLGDGKIKTLECAIMDVADDIAYSSYDLEDSLHAGFVSFDSLIEAVSIGGLGDKVLEQVNAELKKNNECEISNLMDLVVEAQKTFRGDDWEPKIQLTHLSDAPSEVKSAISSALRHSLDKKFVLSPINRTLFTAQRVGRLINQVILSFDENNPMLSSVRLSRTALIDVEIFKRLNYELVIRSPRLAIPEMRGTRIVEGLFQEIRGSRGALLQGFWKERYDACRCDHRMEMRLVCDYVASMTDQYAADLYEALFGGGKSIFKPLA